ncbi:MAG: hypothetical protein MJ252_08210 [archaeon]|nr:hypothetical protein [archaeon]
MHQRMTNAEDMGSIMKEAGYLSSFLKEYFNYIDRKFPDGVPLKDVKDAIQRQKDLNKRISFLEDHLKKFD